MDKTSIGWDKTSVGWRLAKSALAVLLLSGASAIAGEVDSSPVLNAIKEAGVVRVGVKTDVEPFGFINSSSEIVGFEIDLADDIAKRLGVRLIKVPVSTEVRFQKLELGEVDLLLATVGDSLERRKIATAIEPGYFESGVTVMLRPDQRLKDWNAVRGKTLCALQGAYFNRPTSERYLLNLQTYKTVRDALLAVTGGRCDGFLYNGPAIKSLLKKAEFKGYTADFPEALVTPWTIFVKKSEGGKDFDKFLGNVTADWYRNGMINRAAATWGVNSSTWPADEIELWNRKESGGKYTCDRNIKGQWPAECRRVEFVKSDDVSGLHALGLTLKEHTGIDLSYVYDAYDRRQIGIGLAYTLLLTALSIGASLALGLVSATLSAAHIPVISRLVLIVMSLGRLIPPLLMMYFVFFAVGGLLLTHYAVKLPALFVVVMCLAYYTAGIVMSALNEATHLLRKTNPGFQLTLRTVAQAIDNARWPIKQALINVTKMSMIASAIAIPELLSQANLIMAEKGNLIVMMTTLLLAYYLITSFWIHAFTMLENRFYATRQQS
jgi:polar amino acid transport system substrate-binding protein